MIKASVLALTVLSVSSLFSMDGSQSSAHQSAVPENTKESVKIMNNVEHEARGLAEAMNRVHVRIRETYRYRLKACVLSEKVNEISNALHEIEGILEQVHNTGESAQNACEELNPRRSCPRCGNVNITLEHIEDPGYGSYEIHKYVCWSGCNYPQWGCYTWHVNAPRGR